MYQRNSPSPERIAVGAVVQIADGAVQTSGVSITVRGQGGSEGTGGGTTEYGASGVVYYTPLQAETDFTSFVVVASKTGCVPIAQTILTTSSTDATVAEAVLASAVDGIITLAESIRLQNAVLAGKVSGAGTGTETFRDIADTKDRIVATVDANGNRTAIVRDAT